MHLIDIIDFEIGDLIGIQLYDGKIEYGYISEINKDYPYVRISMNDGYIDIDTIGKFNMIHKVQIESQCLTALGFHPVGEDNAYGITSDQWVRTTMNQVWTLTHDNKSLSWTIDLDYVENGESQPHMAKHGIIFIHQLQHYLRNPKLMK